MTAKFFRNGEELTSNHYRGRRDADRFGGVPENASKEVRVKVLNDALPMGRNSAGELVIADRVIFYKNRPSLHKCDARCETAKGHNCECSCGGKNHGIAA